MLTSVEKACFYFDGTCVALVLRMEHSFMKHGSKGAHYMPNYIVSSVDSGTLCAATITHNKCPRMLPWLKCNGVGL